MKCWSCGKEINALSEVKDVHALGLSLQGECPGCGALVSVNSLWRKAAPLAAKTATPQPGAKKQPKIARSTRIGINNRKN
jgi:hypothetical protein